MILLHKAWGSIPKHPPLCDEEIYRRCETQSLFNDMWLCLMKPGSYITAREVELVIITSDRLNISRFCNPILPSTRKQRAENPTQDRLSPRCNLEQSSHNYWVALEQCPLLYMAVNFRTIPCLASHTDLFIPNDYSQATCTRMHTDTTLTWE